MIEGIFITALIFAIPIILFVRHEKQKEEEETLRKIEEEKSIQRKKEEKQRREEAEVRKQRQQYVSSWLNYVKNEYDTILVSLKTTDIPSDYTSLYKKVDDTIANEKTNNFEIKRSYKKLKAEHIISLQKFIIHSLRLGNGYFKESGAPIHSLVHVYNAICCLRIVNIEDAANANNAIDIVMRQISQIEEPTQVLCFESYGVIQSGTFGTQFFGTIVSQADSILESIESFIYKEIDGTCVQLSSSLLGDFVHTTAKLMWYYASASPYDINQFNRASKLFNLYSSDWVRVTVRNQQYNYQVLKVESILAGVLFKKNIGGASIAMQEMDAIEQWLEQFQYITNNRKELFSDELFTLVSGLSWMELYEMELAVLRKCTKLNIGINQELQSRLQLSPPPQNDSQPPT